MSGSDAYLSVAGAAELLGVNRKTVRAEIESGRLPALLVGRCFRIDRGELERRLAYSPAGGDPLAPRRSRRVAPLLGEFARLARSVDSPHPTGGER